MNSIKIYLSAILFLTLPLLSSYSQETSIQEGIEAITESSIKAQLNFLASDWMEGRATGAKGEFLASDYISSMLQFLDVKPAGDIELTKPSRAQRWSGIRPEEYTSYFQNIYMARLLESATELSIIDHKTGQSFSFNENADFYTSEYFNSIDINADIVFVGYGYVNEENNYNDFKNVNVKNKIILRLNGYPGYDDKNSKGYKKFNDEKNPYYIYYLGREKDKIAKENGAIGVIEIYDRDLKEQFATKKDFVINQNEFPRSPDYKYSLKLPSDSLDKELIKIYPSKLIVNKILEGQHINIEVFKKNIANSLKPQSKLLKNIKIGINHKTKTDIIQTRNVLGVIEGEKKNEIVVVGAHYDHLGAKDGFVWNGADDNASGTVGVLMLAKAIKAVGIKPERTIVFAAWTGEELGLMGSRYFAKHPYNGSIENIKFYINFDMISKDSENDTLKNQARMVYTSSYTELEESSKKYIEEYGFNLDINYRPSEKPRGGSDHSSFSAKNIPVMYYMAGFPSDYHTPTDETDDVNWSKMADIIKISFLHLWDIANEE